MAQVLIHQSPVRIHKTPLEVRRLSNSAAVRSQDHVIAAPHKAQHGEGRNPSSFTLLGPSIDLTATRLISSPYNDFANQLVLNTLDLQSRLLAFALTALSPTRPDYATAPYLDSFNWPEVFRLLRSLSRQPGLRWRKQEFYAVIFRSKLLETIDRERLGLLDQKSHEEACASGGLLKYWFGSPDGERRNLATCLWRNYEDAVEGGAGPWHKQARAAAREMYERIDFHVHRLVIEDGAETWRLETFERG